MSTFTQLHKSCNSVWQIPVKRCCPWWWWERLLYVKHPFYYTHRPAGASKKPITRSLNRQWRCNRRIIVMRCTYMVAKWNNVEFKWNETLMIIRKDYLSYLCFIDMKHIFLFANGVRETPLWWGFMLDLSISLQHVSLSVHTGAYVTSRYVWLMNYFSLFLYN